MVRILDNLPSKKNISFLIYILLIVVIVAGAFFTAYVGRYAERDIINESKASTDALSNYIGEELRETERAVVLMARSPWVLPALITRMPEHIKRANSVLDMYNNTLKTSVCYLMDAKGRTIASSNRDAKDSLVGESYEFSSYFKEAMNGSLGRYFAVGMTSNKRGYYTAYPVRDLNDKIVGVVVIKKELDAIEQYLSQFGYCFFVDKNGIIFLSSHEDLLLRSLWPLDEDVKAGLAESKQFGEGSFNRVFSREVISGDSIRMRGKAFLASRRIISADNWSIVLLSSKERIFIYRLTAAAITVIIVLLLLGFLILMILMERSSKIISESEERFKQVAFSSNDWIWEVDKRGRYIYTNHGVRHVLGYEPQEVLGKHLFDFLAPDSGSRLADEIHEIFAKKERIYRLVNKNLHKDGHEVLLETSGLPVLDPHGNLVGYRGVDRDVSQDRQMTESIKTERDAIRQYIDAAKVMIVVLNGKGCVELINKTGCRMLGYSENEIVGKDWFDNFLPENIRKDTKKVFNTILKGQIDSVECFESIVITKSGKEKIIAWNYSVIRDIDGKTVKTISSGEDITERKVWEEEIKKARDYAEMILRVTPSAVFTVDETRRIRTWNKKAEDITGYSRDEIVGKECTMFVEHPCKDLCGLFSDDTKKPIVGKECVIRRKDGQFIYVSMNSDILKDKKGNIIGGVESFEDITARKKYEEKINQLSRAIEQSPSTVAITDVDGDIEYVNPKFTELTGYSPEEVKGKNPRVLKSGEQAPEIYKDMWKKITNGQEWRGEFHNKKKDGGYYWESVSISPIRTAEGKITHYLKVAEDITDRKKQEEALKTANDELETKARGLKKTNEDLKLLYKELEDKNTELEKLDRLKSDFVSTVSHELRTPLAITKEGISLVLDKILGPLTDKQSDILTTSKNNIDRLARIINDLLDISKVEAGKFELKKEAVNLLDIVVHLRSSFEPKVKAKNLELKIETPRVENINVYIDSDRIIQVFTNLIGNAIKYTEQGSVTISVREKGNSVECSVRDTGKGMSREDQTKLFAKFQQFGRSSGPGEKGTGLGLAISKEIIEKHGGRISVKSERDKGSTFYFILPKFDSPQDIFIRTIDESIEHSLVEKKSEELSVMMVRIFNMEEIHNTYGEDINDSVSQALRDCIRSVLTKREDTVDIYSRMNCQCVVFLPGTDYRGVKTVCKRIKESAQRGAIRYAGHRLDVELDFGIAVYPKDGESSDDLMKISNKKVSAKKRILIIDDHPQIARLLINRIGAANRFVYMRAYDGKEGLRIADQELPDLIICDIMMPEMNGYEVIGRLKEDAKTRDIPIIILTAHHVDPGRVKTVLPGSVPVVTKTEGFENLAHLVNELI